MLGSHRKENTILQEHLGVNSPTLTIVLDAQHVELRREKNVVSFPGSILKP